MSIYNILFLDLFHKWKVLLYLEVFAIFHLLIDGEIFIFVVWSPSLGESHSHKITSNSKTIQHIEEILPYLELAHWPP